MMLKSGNRPLSMGTLEWKQHRYICIMSAKEPELSANQNITYMKLQVSGILAVIFFLIFDCHIFCVCHSIL